MSFSNNLQNILEHNNLTAANAAAMCGITTDEFAGYLNGHYEADPRVLETMSNKFNVSVKGRGLRGDRNQHVRNQHA